MKYVLYPLAAFGAYTVAVLATARWWIRRAELNELLVQISETPAPPVRPELVEAYNAEIEAEFSRQQQATADRWTCEQLEHEWTADR